MKLNLLGIDTHVELIDYCELMARAGEGPRRHRRGRHGGAGAVGGRRAPRREHRRGR